MWETDKEKVSSLFEFFQTVEQIPEILRVSSYCKCKKRTKSCFCRKEKNLVKKIEKFFVNDTLDKKFILKFFEISCSKIAFFWFI